VASLPNHEQAGGIAMKRVLNGLLISAALAFVTSPALAQTSVTTSTASKAKEPLTVVYWTARDCRWCTWWEGKVIGSGGEAKFLASPEGKAVRYIVLKKPTLAVPYREEDFPGEHKWLWERVKNETDGKIRGYPSFSLYEGKTFVEYALGEPDVEKKLIPAIRAKM
jgi:hypothetical protein